MKRYYYVSAETLQYYRSSQLPLLDSNLIQVAIPPPTGLATWDLRSDSWSPMTPEEIEKLETETEGDSSDDYISTPAKTTPGAIAVYADNTGRKLGTQDPTGNNFRRCWNHSLGFYSSGATTQYMRRAAYIYSHHAPIVVPYNSVLENVTLSCRDNDPWELRLYVNGKLSHKFLKPKGTHRLNINTKKMFDRDDYFYGRIGRIGNAKVSYPTAELFFTEFN